MSDSAAFYIGSGPDARLVAWASEAASPHELGGWPFLGAGDTSYAEADYWHDLASALTGTLREHMRLATPSGYLDVLEGETDWQYAHHKGAVYVYHHGYLMAQVYPHGARRHTPLPHARKEQA